MAEALYHYSLEPFEFDRTVEYPPDTHGYAKPVGFWVSVGRDWERWCRDEEFRLAHLEHVQQVTLVKKPNVLWIGSAPDLVSFTDRYAYDPEWVIEWRKKDRANRDMFKGHYIDWAAVGESYNGLIIAPYLWSMRLYDGVFWYYGWDCASGCIWNLDVIERLESVALPPYDEAEGLLAGEGEDGAVSPGELDL